MSKRAKRAREQALESQEGPQTQAPDASEDVVGFEFELKKTSTPAVVRYFCRAVGCPGYAHKASQIAHPFGSCGMIVNHLDLEQPKAEELRAVDVEPSHGASEPPELLVETAQTGFNPEGLAAVFDRVAASSHDMPPLDDSELPPGKEGLSVAEITERFGWKPPEASTMAAEPEHEEKQRIEGFFATDATEPVAIAVSPSAPQWAPPAPPDVPPAPPAGTILCRDDSLGDQPDFIEVLDDETPTNVLVYIFPNVHLGTSYLHRSYTPYDFGGLRVVNELPSWALKIRMGLRTLPPLQVKQPPAPVLPETPQIALNEPIEPLELLEHEQPVEPLEHEQPVEPLEHEQPVEPLELEPAPTAPDVVHDETSEPYLPDVGSFLACGEQIFEIVARWDTAPAVDVWIYESEDGPIQFSTGGTIHQQSLLADNFGPGRLEPLAYCPPPWILNARVQRMLSDLHDTVTTELDDGKPLDVEAAAADAIEVATQPEPPEIPQFSAQDGATPHPLHSIASVIHELAEELDVKPLHVMRAVESGLQTFGQLLTFKEMASTSPAVESLSKLLSVNLMREGGFFRGLREGLSLAMRSVVDERLNEYSCKVEEKIASLSRVTQGSPAPANVGNLSAKADKAVIAELRELVKDDCRELVSKAFEAWESKHKSPGNPEDWAEVARDLGKAESRIFKLEGGLSNVLDELKNYNRSVKLLKEDPQDATARGKAFREREKQKAREKAANLATLRKQKQEAEALERGKERKKTPKSKWKQTTIKGAGLDDPGPRGTPKRLKNPAQSVAKPLAANMKVVDKFMGKAKDEQVRALLGRLPPSQLAKFLAAAAKGTIAVETTDWNGSELGQFAKWFYATTNKR